VKFQLLRGNALHLGGESLKWHGSCQMESAAVQDVRSGELTVESFAKPQ